MQRPVRASEETLLEDLASGTAVKMPAVAAIVCNFNQRDYLSAAITSVAQQTYPYVECVVVDDCSTDGSAQVIQQMLATQERPFKFIRHEENRGQMAAMLSGLDATTAPFVAWIDGDDVWLPGYLERHMGHHLNSQINAAVSTSNLAVIDATSTLIAGAVPSMSTTNPQREWKRTVPITPARFGSNGPAIDFATEPHVEAVFINRHYESWVWSPTSGLVFRRAAINAIRPPDASNLRISADHYLARFSHILGGTIWIGETLGYYRVHGANNLSKAIIYGDSSLGSEPEYIAAEGNYQFARRMRESSALVLPLIQRHHRAALVTNIGRRAKAIEQIVANGSVFGKLPFKLKARLLRRYLADQLRGAFSRQ
jgi:glycosyltransferase involved in cell wall biosynthesis